MSYVLSPQKTRFYWVIGDSLLLKPLFIRCLTSVTHDGDSGDEIPMGSGWVSRGGIHVRKDKIKLYFCRQKTHSMNENNITEILKMKNTRKCLGRLSVRLTSASVPT
jgi:ribosomal protein L24E